MKVLIKTQNTRMERTAETGARLDDVILAGGLLLDRPCSGRGSCGKCRVWASGKLSVPTDLERKLLGAEALAAGTRLACQAVVLGDVEVRIESGAVCTDKTFSTGVDPASIEGELGLAIDLGTTTVAAFLVGLADGKVHAGHATLNHQAKYGAEVMSRLLVQENGDLELANSAWQSILMAASGLGLDESARGRVTRAVVVGNSAMHHLLLGYPIGTLLRSPFEPHSVETVETLPGPLAAQFSNLAFIRHPPLLGGFVGSDALACLLYFDLGRNNEASLTLDLGTNGEVLLAAGGKIYAASTAAGPAFEGVNISCGMRAMPGAITSVTWEEKGFILDTVDAMPPRGLTGSGLLSVIRALCDLGAVDHSGRITGAGPGVLRIGELAGVKRIVIADNVWVTQTDVRELQKAKAAVRAAADILIERAGVAPADLDRVILTGSFGGRAHPADVLELGVLPGVRPGRIYSIANGAGMGAAAMLMDDGFDRAVKTAARVEHVELNLDPGFMERYVAHMALCADQAGAHCPAKDNFKEDFA